jgi:hypothetical protein
MSDYTKVTIKKAVAEQGKIQAAAQNRSLANYVEHLILIAPTEQKDDKQPNGSEKL